MCPIVVRTLQCCQQQAGVNAMLHNLYFVALLQQGTFQQTLLFAALDLLLNQAFNMNVHGIFAVPHPISSQSVPV